MHNTFQNELWDKPNAIITFNDINTNSFDKFQKFIGDFCKSQSINIINQKRLFDKFLSDNVDMKNSDYSFSNCNYTLTEKLLEILNIYEIFNDALLNEVDEMIKNKLSNIKKETKTWKNEKRKLFDDLNKENVKHDSEFKRYCSRFNAKELAYNAYLKADDNKFLSRNQVDNFQKVFLNRKSEYEQTKSEYSLVLNNFNQYQTNHYSTSLPNWSCKGEEIENLRYDVLKSTFTNLSELCRSLASKFLEMADKIEMDSEKIDCKNDCLTLISKEKTGDIPPGAISFKDFDCDRNGDLSVTENKVKNVSSSSSDSTSIVNGKKKNSVPEVKLRNESSKQELDSSLNTAANLSTSSGSSNGIVGGSVKSFSFSKLFGGSKKSKDSINPVSEIENLEVRKEDQIEIDHIYDSADNVNQVENKKNPDSKSATLSSIKPLASARKTLLFQSVRSSRKTSIDNTCSPAESSKIGSLLSRIVLRKDPEKRRSRSVSNFNRNTNELNNNNSQHSSTHDQPEQPESVGISASKLISKTQRKSKIKEPKETSNFNSRRIEVIRSIGPVEIVSTPAEAMASLGNRVDSIYASEYEIGTDVCNQNLSLGSLSNQIEESQSYCYYYVGSCVAIHEYTTSDPSDIYLSFNAGDQFYIIKEDNDGPSNGWLLVERIDKSGHGYVPESYMDTRRFDAPVVMYSNHPMIMT